MFRSLLAHGFALAFFFGGGPRDAVEDESPNQFAQNLSALGRKPDWSELQKYQATITHDEFVHLLNDVYCPQGYNPDLIQVEAGGGEDSDRDRNARSISSCTSPRARRDRLPVSPARGPRRRRCRPTKGAGPLTGFHIALDPGHLGGTWAKMEERWFKIGDAAPVQEGDMTLHVAQIAQVATRVVRRESLDAARHDGADHALSALRFRGDRPAIAGAGWDRRPAGEFRRPGRSGERTHHCAGNESSSFIETAKSGGGPAS